MIPRVSWMVPADWIILFFLSEHRWRFTATPSVIAENVGISSSHANRRCKILEDAGLVELWDERGYYRVTDYGQRYMVGDVDSDELEDLEPDEP